MNILYENFLSKFLKKLNTISDIPKLAKEFTTELAEELSAQYCSIYINTQDIEKTALFKSFHVKPFKNEIKNKAHKIYTIGTERKYIKQCLEEGKDIILEIETKGALQVKKQMPEAVLIFIAPPSLEALEQRLRGRHTEDEETIQKRLNEVKAELELAKQYDYKVVNDNLEDAVNTLEKIITGEQKC